MEYLGWVLLGGLIVVLVKLYESCFRTIEHYIENKGFQSNTVCYIKSPYSSSIHTQVTNTLISNWIIKGIVGITIVGAILAAYLLSEPFVGIIVILSDFLLVLVYYRIYSEANGVKLLESGVARGVQIITWDEILQYQFKMKVKSNDSDLGTLKLKIEKKIIPINIEITNRNKPYLEKYLSEHCTI